MRVFWLSLVGAVVGGGTQALRPERCWPTSSEAASSEASFDTSGYWLNLRNVSKLAYTGNKLNTSESKRYPKLIHIPKTGGSTLVRCAKLKLATHPRCPKQHSGCGGGVCGVMHAPLRGWFNSSAAAEAELGKKESRLCVVRHPYERFLSLWRMESCSRLFRARPEFKSWLANAGIYNEVRHWERREDRREFDSRRWYASCVETSGNVGIFEKWAQRKLSLISLACEKKSNKDPLMSCADVGDSCHSMAQTAQVFFPNGDRACDHIIRYENVLGDLDDLQRAYGLPPDAFDCMHHKDDQMQVVIPRNASRITSKDIPEDILLQLNTVYAVDFKNFNFCQSHPHSSSFALPPPESDSSPRQEEAVVVH